MRTAGAGLQDKSLVGAFLLYALGMGPLKVGSSVTVTPEGPMKVFQGWVQDDRAVGVTEESGGHAEVSPSVPVAIGTV